MFFNHFKNLLLTKKADSILTRKIYNWLNWLESKIPKLLDQTRQSMARVARDSNNYRLDTALVSPLNDVITLILWRRYAHKKFRYFEWFKRILMKASQIFVLTIYSYEIWMNNQPSLSFIFFFVWKIFFCEIKNSSS